MAGHVESGETYQTAFFRETKEELGFNTEEINWKYKGYLNPRKNSVSSHMCIYEIKYDKVPPYNTNEFVDYYWFTPKELIEKIESGAKTKDDLVKVLKIFYS